MFAIHVVGAAVVLQWFASLQRNAQGMTDEHIRLAWVLQCESRGTECSTIALNVLSRFNNLSFRVHGESSFLLRLGT